MIRNKKNQTAFDRMLELKSEITINYLGKQRGLKEIVEMMVLNKKSPLYKLPEGEVEGEDFRQDALIGLVRQFELTAYEKMREEFPEIEAELKRRNKSIQKESRKAIEAFLQY